MIHKFVTNVKAFYAIFPVNLAYHIRTRYYVNVNFGGNFLIKLTL